MKHSSSELEETEPGEEKSCLIYDTGPCSYMGPPFMSTPRYGPHMRRGGGFKCSSPSSSASLAASHSEVLKKRSSPSLSFMALRDVLYRLRCLSV